MSGLLQGLSTAAGALDASRMGLDVAGQNIANINTDGYTRRTLLQSEQAPSDPLSAGRGVSIDGIQSRRDQFVETRIWREQNGGARDKAVVGGLTDLEAAIGQAGSSLDGNFTSFFDTFSTLASDPTSASARTSVVSQGQSLAATFRDIAGRLVAARDDADDRISGDIAKVNELAAQVARLNDQISSDGVDVETLRDQRNVAIGQLSQIAGVGVLSQSDGQFNVTIGSGRPLVIGGTAYPVTGVTTPPTGAIAIQSNGLDLTNEITGGELGGLRHLRDDLIAGYQGKLDRLAYDVATAVNAIHQGGFDAHGVAGTAFFVPPAAVGGAAAGLQVSTAVAADSSLVAASATGAIGDNQVARALSNLRDANVVNGNAATPSEAWGQIAYAVGADVNTAQSSSQSHDDVLLQLQRLRAQASGVSLDEEAANLMRYQRAYEANARYFTTIVTALDTLMAMVR